MLGESAKVPPRQGLNATVWSAAWRYRHWFWPASVALVLMVWPVIWCLGIWGAPESPQAYQPFVPFAVAYLIWTRRAGLADLARQTADQHRGSMLLAACGCALMIMAYPPEIPGLSLVAMTLIVAGGVYYLYGLPMLRALRGPLIFLLAAAPLQEAIMDRATGHLQIACTGAASAILQLIHIPVSTEGNMMVVSDCRLEITPACSGLTLLMPVMMAAIWLMMLMQTTLLQRVLLAAYSLLTALLLNVVRIAAMGLLAFYDRDMAFLLHDTNSWLFTVLAFAAMLFWTRLLRINKVCNPTYDLHGSLLPPPP